MNQHAVSAANKFWEVIPAVMRSTLAEARRGSHDMTPHHFRILRALSMRECSVSELAQHQDVSLPSMSDTVQTLVERGWLDRVGSEHDRRVTQLKLTRKGQQVLINEHKRLVGWIAQRLDKLPAEHVIGIEEAFERLLQLFEESPEQKVEA